MQRLAPHELARPRDGRGEKCRLAIVGLVVLGLVPGCARPSERSPATANAAPVAGAAWSKFVDEFLEAYYRANPSFAVSQGRHEFDGALPDWSKAGIEAESLRLQRMRERALGFRSDALDDAQRFERDYLVSRIDNDLFWLTVAEQPFHNPAYYLDGLNPSVYVVRPYASPDVRMRAFIAHARSIVRVAPDIRANLRTPMPVTYLKYGVAAFSGLADFFRKEVHLAFEGVGDAQLQQELVAASEAAARSLTTLSEWLASELPKGTGPQPLGPERYGQMLRMTEGVDIQVAALEAACRADVERNTAALRAACARIAPGLAVAECVERVQAKKAAGGPVAGARQQLVELRKFLDDRDIVTIPGTEEAQVDEAPAFNRQNFAYIEIPGPYEKGLPSVYYIAPPDPSWPAAEQLAYVRGEVSLLFTSAHEVWPGHFLQFLHANRVESIVGRVFVGYAFAEGWAHYAEEMMWEKGLRGDPETHVGQLTNALLRNVRMLSSIGLHTQGTTVEESERMFLELAFQDAGNARQQAARGTYDPGYLNYTLGKLVIRKLRSDWCASRGGERAWKAFHDEILSYGGPPLALLRRAMMPGDTGAML
ncbi:MAG: DUF885 domain-containing protein [Planctomycetota bacterium]